MRRIAAASQSRRDMTARCTCCGRCCASGASRRNASSFTAPTKIRGFLHLYIGEEAVAVGAISASRPEDAVVATYREHGQALGARRFARRDHGRDVWQDGGLRARPRWLDAFLRCEDAPLRWQRHRRRRSAPRRRTGAGRQDAEAHARDLLRLSATARLPKASSTNR